MPNNIQTHHKGNFTISTDPSRLDVGRVHNYLASSYWARGIPYKVVEKSLTHSLCFGVYAGDRQIGLGRVITDRATFAYLADVFIIDEFQGQGLGKWLMSCILNHPDLQGLRRLILATKDAHGLYAQFGFEAMENPGRFMENVTPYEDPI